MGARIHQAGGNYHFCFGFLVGLTLVWFWFQFGLVLVFLCFACPTLPWFALVWFGVVWRGLVMDVSLVWFALARYILFCFGVGLV